MWVTAALTLWLPEDSRAPHCKVFARVIHSPQSGSVPGCAATIIHDHHVCSLQFTSPVG